MAARLTKPAYYMNDAPRKWWNRLGKTLQILGRVPTRADICIYALYSETDKASISTNTEATQPSGTKPLSALGDVLEHLLSPVTGSQSEGRCPHGVLALHVDDFFMWIPAVQEECR
jgi:hypothetical protein